MIVIDNLLIKSILGLGADLQILYLYFQAEYPIVWSAARADRIDSAAGTPFTDIIYVAKVMVSSNRS